MNKTKYASFKCFLFIQEMKDNKLNWFLKIQVFKTESKLINSSSPLWLHGIWINNLYDCQKDCNFLSFNYRFFRELLWHFSNSVLFDFHLSSYLLNTRRGENKINLGMKNHIRTFFLIISTVMISVLILHLN